MKKEVQLEVVAPLIIGTFEGQVPTILIREKQFKNTLNNINSNTAQPETSGSIIARPEHSNTDEAEENNL